MQAARGIPRVAHLALNALDTEAILDFYREIFGFRELFEAHKESRKKPGYRNKHVGDGFTNVAIQAFYNDDEGHEARFGIAHFGFLVPDPAGECRRPWHGRRDGEGPSEKIRTQSEIRMRDPEGNGCDLSQRGWEVDTDKWVCAGGRSVMGKRTSQGIPLVPAKAETPGNKCKRFGARALGPRLRGDERMLVRHA